MHSFVRYFCFFDSHYLLIQHFYYTRRKLGNQSNFHNLFSLLLLLPFWNLCRFVSTGSMIGFKSRSAPPFFLPVHSFIHFSAFGSCSHCRRYLLLDL